MHALRAIRDTFIVRSTLAARRSGMSKPAKVGDLEIEQDLGQQRLEWKLQRVAWILMLLLGIAAFLGITGSGPYAKAIVRGGTVEVSYARFCRRDASTELLVRLPALPHPKISIDAGYLSNFRMETITPPPHAVVEAAGGRTFEFLTSPGQSTLSVSFRMTPQTYGRIRGEVRQTTGESAVFTQFVYF